MMPTLVGVDFLEDLLSFFWRDVSLEDAGCASFVKLSVNDRVCLCSPLNLVAQHFIVFRQLFVHQEIDVWRGPIWGYQAYMD